MSFRPIPDGFLVITYGEVSVQGTYCISKQLKSASFPSQHACCYRTAMQADSQGKIACVRPKFYFQFLCQCPCFEHTIFGKANHIYCEFDNEAKQFRSISTAARKGETATSRTEKLTYQHGPFADREVRILRRSSRLSFQP